MSDRRSARQVMNGLDKADPIKGYALKAAGGAEGRYRAGFLNR